eukprot:CAMPEP_0196584986 /NCGR_PEP_ID=MMETSP1081-20130531/49222_1 /TAXON_ID=36882 /ORGANISM="Pyramimonas amylifera, Strain CCMP720" /LENGTH=412 /DNA_ID=CAMNT_0041906385 /DNA_START=64 /DNA_END=1302 /DNA_ORIENTATION=+
MKALKKFQFLFFVLAVSSGILNVASYSFDDEFENNPNVLEESKAREVFQEWTRHHEKQYSDEQETQQRFHTFWSTMKHVHAHNSLESGFKLGLNLLADLTPAEAAKKVGGHIPVHSGSFDSSRHIPGEDLDSSCGFSAQEQQTSFSKGVDWREKEGVLGPVKNQGACGSCWAYSVTAAVEAVTAIMTEKPVLLSEQELTDCNWLGSYCDGGNVEEGFKWVTANGLGSLESYPYNNPDHTNTTCKVHQAFSRSASIDNYEMVPRGEEALRKALSISPVSIGVDAFAPDFMAYKSGIYDGVCKRGIENLGHAVAAVGYGSENGVPYFVLRNSWTADWGEGGYIRIRAGKYPNSGTCGIGMLVVRPIKDGSVQFHVNGTWPDWAKKYDPSKKDLPQPDQPGPVNPHSPPSLLKVD